MNAALPTLSETPAILRDRAIGEANELRQVNAELREALRQLADYTRDVLTGPIMTAAGVVWANGEPQPKPLLRARALLAKVSK